MVDSTLRIDVDLAAYPIEAIRRAAYAFAEQHWIEIISAVPPVAIVEIRSQSGQPLPADARAAFMNSLADFSLRVEIETKTRVVRELLVKTALERAAPQPRPTDDAA